MLRLATLLIAAILASQTAALNFAVNSVNCRQLEWTVELNASEWSLTSNVELFFSGASIGAQTYSLLYSALPSGPVPSAGSFQLTTMFGATALNGRYAIGVELLDASGALIVPSASNNFLQSTATDNRVFTFSNCSAEIAAGGTAVTTTTGSAALPTSTSLSSSARLASSTSVAPSSLATSATAQPTTTPPPTSSTASAAAAPSMHMSSTGAIVGGVIGGIVAVLALLALFRFCSKRQRAQRTASIVRHKAIVLKRRSSSNASPEISEHVLEEGGAAESDRYAAAHGPRSDTSHQVWTPYAASAAPSIRSAANPFRDQAQEEPAEIKMVQVPFQLSTPRLPGQQEVPLHRVSSSPMTNRDAPSPSVEAFATDSTSESNHTARPVSAAGTQRRGDGSPPRSVSTFKIPRVSVPTYNSNVEPTTASVPQTPTRNMQRSPSGGNESLMSAEDPFVDARQETSPELRRHY